MQVVIDTNVFIHREDDDIVPKPLRELEKTLNQAGHTITVHPESVAEIRNDDNDERRRKAESRIETYVELGYPPTPLGDGSEFREHVGKASSENERVDNMLLYAVYEDAADILVTEDRGIHKKALALGIQDRVFTIEEGRDFFASERPSIRGPAAIERTTLGELDLDDPIFNSLKEMYDGFVEWARSKQDRPAWVNYCESDQLGAILVLKPDEVENIGDSPPLGRERRLKISTLKVAQERWGSKVGELLLSIAIREAISREVDKVYLTHFVEDKDYLVELIESFGFRHASDRQDGEGIFLKQLTPEPDADLGPVETARQFYPSFYDGKHVGKFLVPIQPKYHKKLFTGYEKRQPPLQEFSGEFNSEGNAIRKAYLSNSKTKQIESGDLLLFYRSGDHQEVTSLGVCEDVTYRLTDPGEIQRKVGKRSVFSESEIVEMASSPTTVILFTWHFDFPSPISLSKLLESGVVSGAPQTIQSISEEGYKYVRREGDLDERFALH